MIKPSFVYVTFIRTTSERLWSALTGPEFMKQYWFGMHCESDFKTGSPWKLINDEGKVYDAGSIVEADAPRRLVIRWRNEWNEEMKAEGDTLCTMELEAIGPAVKLSITHSMEREGSKFIGAVSGGWPKILSNLKSLMETGAIALEENYPAKK